VSNGVVNREINRAAGKVRTLYRLPSHHSSPHVLTTTLHRVAVGCEICGVGYDRPCSLAVDVDSQHTRFHVQGVAKSGDGNLVDNLTFLYPFGATMTVDKPAIPVRCLRHRCMCVCVVGGWVGPCVLTRTGPAINVGPVKRDRVPAREPTCMCLPRSHQDHPWEARSHGVMPHVPRQLH
jgi:hypothetical protein